jgi:Flp pilus assembly protein TadB
MATTYRHPMKGRAAALLLTLLLGLGLTVQPASAATDAQQRATAAVTTERTGYASPDTASDLSLRRHASRHHASSARFRTSKTRKKSGFFKKLGIFLLVVFILVILLVALLVWFLVRLVRRTLARGGRR